RPETIRQKNIHKTPCGNSAIEELTAVLPGRIALQATLEFKEARLGVLRAPICGKPLKNQFFLRVYRNFFSNGILTSERV
uniref:hypothetical protein n=1 Tax=Ruegeria atlantica TaxID=81569 RepID=UPI00147AB6D3